MEIPPCAQSHESYKFSTRCQWFYFACCRRALGGLQNIREKAVRNLSRLLPNGYQYVNAILPEAYNETAAGRNEAEITRIYLGRGKDAVLLWEEGMELPAASPAMEKAVGGEN